MRCAWQVDRVAKQFKQVQRLQANLIYPPAIAGEAPLHLAELGRISRFQGRSPRSPSQCPSRAVMPPQWDGTVAGGVLVDGRGMELALLSDLILLGVPEEMDAGGRRHRMVKKIVVTWLLPLKGAPPC